MKLTLHDYQLDGMLRQRDGVNLAYKEVMSMLKARNYQNIDVDFHNFLKLCQDDVYAYKILSNVDCVISNVGPHAHYYFYLREKFGLSFRIIRDVREALRSNYLLQEYLCRAYLRDTDILIFASEYARQMFFEIYPHLRSLPTVICYPLMRSFPPRKLRKTKTHLKKKQVTLGYVGRLSEDKNFPQLIDLIIRLQNLAPGKYRLVALGDIHSPSCDPLKLIAQIERETGRADIFQHFPAIDHDQVWEFYDGIDIFLFPSTSNIETFGRVLIEASYCDIPIVAGDHAAASELLPMQSLVPVSYYYNTRFSTHFDFPLGEVDIEHMLATIESGQVVPSDGYRKYEDHSNLFLRLLTTSNVADELTDIARKSALPEHRNRLIESVRVMDMPASRDIHQTNVLMREMLLWFCQLQDKNSEKYRSKLKELLAISKYPERTLRYIDKSLKSRGDFTNVGGVDFELCHIAAFYPNFELVDHRTE